MKEDRRGETHRVNPVHHAAVAFDHVPVIFHATHQYYLIAIRWYGLFSILIPVYERDEVGQGERERGPHIAHLGLATGGRICAYEQVGWMWYYENSRRHMNAATPGPL